MAIRSVTYNTNVIGAGPYTITFPYLTEGDVEVYLDGVLNTEWTIASTTQLTLDEVPSEAQIEIRSNTQDEPYVDFTAPGPIPPENLDTATLQAIYIAQEAKDSVEVVQDGVDDVVADLAAEVAARIADVDAEEAARIADVNAEEAARIVDVNAEEAARIAADGVLQGNIDEVADNLADAQIAAGNVPTPSDPADDGKVLTAEGGLYGWEDPDSGVPAPANPADDNKVLLASGGLFSWVALLAAHISDATAFGRSLLQAASAAAARTLLGSTTVGDAVFIAATAAAARATLVVADAVHTHAASDIASGTIAQARLGTGSGGAGLKALFDDQTYKTISGGIQPCFLLAPEAATFPAASFPQIKKADGTNWSGYSLGFDNTADEAAFWKFKIPTTAVFTAATLKVVSRQLAATSGTVAWQITTITRADGEAYDTAGVVDDVAAVTVNNVAGELLFQTKAITVTGWAAGEVLYVKLNRDVSADDVAEDAELVCAMIELS